VGSPGRMERRGREEGLTAAREGARRAGARCPERAEPRAFVATSAAGEAMNLSACEGIGASEEGQGSKTL
jgi:hypothetical protein